MESGRSFTIGLFGLVLGFLAGNEFGAAVTGESARLHAELDQLQRQVITLRHTVDAQEELVAEIIADVAES